ncbi:MAG: SRPBCC family protein [Actinomycetota bacterium]
MSTIEESVEVQVPLSTAYNQWTQFQEFPRFMEGVERVEQLDDKSLTWVARVKGQTREFQARITEQKPDERVAWVVEGGPFHAGVVTFHRIDDATTRIMLQMEYQPESFVEKAGDAAGFVKRQVSADLQRFKGFIESRGTETGAWRGEIDERRAG